MSLTNDQIIEAIGEKSVLEIVELIKAMEEKFGVSAAAASAGPAAAAAVVEEQTEFNVMLLDCLLYTSPSPRDMRRSRMPSSA